MVKTYSFSDVSFSMHHPSIGSYSAIGEGIGDFTVSYANSRTAQDVAADGSVMTSKIKAKHGTVALNILQTSDMEDYLEKWWKYIEVADSSEYTLMTITIQSTTMGINIVCSGVAPEKPADKPFQAQGQRMSWTLMAENIDI